MFMGTDALHAAPSGIYPRIKFCRRVPNRAADLEPGRTLPKRASVRPSLRREAGLRSDLSWGGETTVIAGTEVGAGCSSSSSRATSCARGPGLPLLLHPCISSSMHYFIRAHNRRVQAHNRVRAPRGDTPMSAARNSRPVCGTRDRQPPAQLRPRHRYELRNREKALNLSPYPVQVACTQRAEGTPIPMKHLRS